MMKSDAAQEDWAARMESIMRTVEQCNATPMLTTSAVDDTLAGRA